MAKKFKSINISHVTKEAGLQKDKLYNLIEGKYKQISNEDKEAIFKASYPDIKAFLYKICGKKITISSE